MRLDRKLPNFVHVDKFNENEDRILEFAEKIEKIIEKEEVSLDRTHRILSCLIRVVRELIHKELGVKRTENCTNMLRKFGIHDKFGRNLLQEPIDSHNIIDHVTKVNNRYMEYLSSEPYNVDMRDLKGFIKFCEERNLNFWIDGKSIHFPNNTFRLNICEIKNETKRNSKK